MAPKEKEDKIVLEREYIVPLRSKTMNTPFYKRTPRAVRVLKQFLAKHMKVTERDTSKIKLDRYLNEELWARGIRKPLSKVKVKCKKFESGIVRVELVDIPQVVKFKIDREKKLLEVGEKTKKEVKKEKEKTEEDKEKEKQMEEKKDAVKEAGMAMAEQQHKQMKHMQTKEKPVIQRKALQK